MIRALLRRLGVSLFTIWAIVSLSFLVFNLLPEDPARAIAGPQARPSEVALIRKNLGLDEPLLARYGLYLGNLVCLNPNLFGDQAPLACPRTDEKLRNSASLGLVWFDLGESYLRREPVVTILAERLPASMLLGALALLFQTVFGTLIGVLAAYRKGTRLDWALVTGTLLGVSAPTFITGLFLQQAFGRELGWFPMDGYGPPEQRLYFAVLPALTLGLYGTSAYARLVRDEMVGLLRQDYVRTARAKGLSEPAVLVRHALRNALMPLVTILGIDAGLMVSGAIVTEQVFRWPGVGRLSVEAIRELDGPVVMGVVLAFSTFVVLANLVVDLSYAALDPRARAAA